MTEANKTKTKIQAGITIVFGGLAVYLIIHEPANSEKIKWAYGIVGLIFGYWLK